MQAFKNDPELKAGLLAEVEKHRVADRIVSGTYGDFRNGEFHGCAVGCSIQSYNLLRGKNISAGSHEAYESEFEIPVILARLEDRIFEGLPKDRQGTWPGQFFAAIEPGADLSNVWPKFAIWLLMDADHGAIRYATSPKTKTAIERVAELYRLGGTKEQFKSAAAAAYAADAAADADAAAAAAAADAAAADAAAAAAAAYAAADADAAAAAAAYAAADADAAAAAYAAAADAADAADAAAAAAYAAADADAAAAAYAAAAYARQKAFIHQSEKLLELLAGAK